MKGVVTIADRMEIEARMKDYYESTSQLSLVRRIPVIIRIDGHNFKSLTKHFDKPFDTKFRAAMRSTTHELVRQFQGAVFAYTQSDEISILLKDYTHLDTQAAYKNNLQKLVSLSASYATMFFNKYMDGYGYPATFDSRAFNIPKEEVVNYFYWRQLDCKRNAIAMIGRAIAGKKSIKGLNIKEIIKLLESTYNVNIEDYGLDNILGWYTSVVDGHTLRSGEACIFIGEGRNIIETLL